jgi:triosephosphate isomerase
LSDAARLLDDGPVALGAQDVCAESTGAFTGQVSAAMLKDVGCSYVLVGHSERRRLNHEDDTLVARKFVAAAHVGLIPVLCVGETLEERELKQTESVVERQLDAVIKMHGPAMLSKAILAYAFLRHRIAAHDAKIARELRILYGGSVKGSNAAELFAMPDVDGGLVGGASLSADEFRQICAAAAARH